MIYPWHQSIWAQFQHLLADDKLASCYLFYAHKSQGLLAFANELTNAVFCKSHNNCQQCKGCHNISDKHVITQEADNHNVQGIRDMSLWLQTTPTQGVCKLVLLTDLEQLNHHAMNALLKILEEPPSYAKFILTCHQLDKVLLTIRSRCQQVRLPSPSHQDVESYFDHYELPQSTVAQLFQFKPLDISAWSEKNHDATYAQIIQALLQGQLAGIEALQKLLDDMPVWAFDFMLHVQKDIILHTIGQDEYKTFPNVTFKKDQRRKEALNGLFLVYDRLLAYKDAVVGQHVGFHKPLLIEYIWNQWSGHIHGARASASI